MTSREDSGITLPEALEMSADPAWSTRVTAAEQLGRFIDDPAARHRLEELLRDPGDVAVQVAAAEVLTRGGGTKGVLAVLEEVGRRADDPDADYIAYKLYELEGMGEYPVLATASAIDPADITPNSRVGIANVKRLLGVD
ncbi:HEAT repeat domain-containing protein [Nocardia sp. NPDC004068]|uniref:HEAT repeat domain-containing protein n=1 Tax=Nocardia sp. NPDC004068 TaxID=3364303 RepID=UPI0036901547